MSDRALVYIASPLGFADSTEAYRALVSRAVLAEDLEPLDPWRDDDKAIAKAFKTADAITNVSERRRALARLDMDLGRRNHQMLARAHAVLAILDGTDVDSGTASEIGLAAALELPIVGLRSDKRQSGENEGCSVNLQVEYFVRLHGGAIFPALEEAVRRLRALLQGHHGEAIC